MAIPCTGTIKASDINVELGRPTNGTFKIGSPDERALAGKPSGLIKFSDFYCKSAADPLPWNAFSLQTIGGRPISGGVAQLWNIDGSTIGIWGGSVGLIKFNNHFLRPITQVTFQTYYQNTNAWHTVFVYERTNTGSQVALGNYVGLQTFTLNVNVPAGQELWFTLYGGGDQGDANLMDLFRITNVVYA
ncbi:hypothetical protein [Yersinia phage fHe-Yen9-04]|uniref:Uncharacterized protein n=2 Tax=Eneladusvirus Yen904 TaxID=2560849 RepID=A0A2C9CXJ2_9CAUD|nr:hypothetical protein FDJ41_gp254 [Yersinia phage fHe-Yen9-04]SOK58531.1 hypothetical protein [Yersinia phage fHe-Yen9-04]SOK59065.1 hypothetical protein [Yersinia phage fHe-Yen9-03]VUE36300.1 hypothetical protein [Yersinia phage fHe-Yen9-04]